MKLRLLLPLLLVAASLAQAANDPRAARFYEDALARYQKGDVNGAIIQLKNALQVDKSMLQVHLLLGRALLDASDVAASEVALDEALRLGVNRAEVVLSLARAVADQGRPQEVISGPRFEPEGLPPAVRYSLLLAKASAASDLGQTRDALQFLDQARGLGGDPTEGLLAEVPIRIRAGQFAEAMAAAGKAAATAPRNAEAAYAVASVHHALGDATRAHQAYGKALALLPTHLEALIGRAGVSMDLGKTAQAKADLDKLRQVQPKEPRAAYLAAVLAEQQGDTAAARAALTEVAALLDPVPPDFLRFKPQLLMLGGLAHFGLGQLERAKPYLQGVHRMQGNVAASKLLAQIYISEGNIDGAINALDSYLKLAPRDVAAVELLAQAHLTAGRPMRSVQILQNELKVQPSSRLRTGLGLALLRAGKPKEALPVLEEAWAKDPSQVRAGAALANLLAQGRDIARATRVAESLVKRQPANPGFQDLLGTIRLRQRDTVGARKAFEEALRLDPAAAPPRLNLARMDLAAGKTPQAVEHLQQVLKQDARNVEAMLEMAGIEERRSQREAAAQWYQKAIDVSGPKDLRAAILLVSFHLRGGEDALALKATERLSAQGSEDLGVLVTAARARIANGDRAGAKPLLGRATSQAQFDPAAQTEIAILQLAIDNLPGAAYSLDKALSTEPDHLHASAVSVDLLLRQGELDRAEKTARRISAQNPRRGVGPALEGDVALARGQLPAALVFYRRAHALEPSSHSLARLHRLQARIDPAAARQLAEQWIRANPKDVEVRRLHADTLARSGLNAEARRAYEELLAVAPRDGRALNNLANVLLLLRDPGALPVAEKALQQRPNQPDVLDTVAWAAFQAGQKERALQMLRDARLRAPENPEIRYHLAQVLADAGRKAEARLELEAAMRATQPFSSAREARALLETLK